MRASLWKLVREHVTGRGSQKKAFPRTRSAERKGGERMLVSMDLLEKRSRERGPSRASVGERKSTLLYQKGRGGGRRRHSRLCDEVWKREIGPLAFERCALKKRKRSSLGVSALSKKERGEERWRPLYRPPKRPCKKQKGWRLAARVTRGGNGRRDANVTYRKRRRGESSAWRNRMPERALV